MDVLTQAVIGAAAGQAAGSPALGRRAAAVGALAGWLPDADVLLRSAADPLLSLELHRGFTHSLAFIPAGAALAAAPFLLSRELRARPRALYLTAVAGWATHGLLDACTSYGTQLLWPFTDWRAAWNVISIIDPVFTLPLLVAVLLAVLRRRAAFALAGLAWAVAWLGVGGVQRERARAVQAELARARDHAPVRARVDPTLGNVLLWRSLYETADGRIQADAIRVPAWGPATIRAGRAAPRASEESLLRLVGGEHAAAARAVRTWQWFADGWVTRGEGREGEVVLTDVRYGADPAGLEPLWTLTLRPGDPARPVSRSGPRPSGRGIGALWLEVTGRDPRHRTLREAGGQALDARRWR